MQLLFAAVTGIGFVELMIRLPVFPTLAQLHATMTKAMAVIGSNTISDHWKEKVLPAYAARLFRLTMLMAIYLLAAFAPLFAVSAVAIALKVPFLEFAMSWVGIGLITIIAATYAKLRSARVPAKL
jgi:hypothetical protein